VGVPGDKVVVVIGLGSMGRRRVRLMKRLSGVEIVGVDLSSERRAETEKTLGIEAFASLDEALVARKCRAAFVCTSPASHATIILSCIGAGLHVFTELNLRSDKYDDIVGAAESKGVKLFLSSTFLYREELRYVETRVAGTAVDYIYHVGQYLPDWHPWESYKDYFVSVKATNACREILAIEIPWMLKTFGKVTDVVVKKRKVSSLDIDFCDTYSILLEHASGSHGVFCVDVVSRKAVRTLEVYSEAIHLFWGGSPNTLAEYDFGAKALKPVWTYESVEDDKRYNETIIENAYLEEIKVFFRMTEGLAEPRYTFEEDKSTLALLDRIEA
jgi:predicted dehydrogenase